MLFEDDKNKIYSSEEVDLMSALDLEYYDLHVYYEES